MKKIIGIVMVLLMLMSATVALADGAAKDDKSNEKVPVIVGFKDDVKRVDQSRMIGDNDGAIKKSYTLINAATANVPRHKIDTLKKNRNVKYVEEDIRIQVIEGQTLPWGVDRIDAELVHPYNKGTGVKVAIIDTGIDYTHPDLNDNYVAGWDFANDDNDPMDGGGHGTHCAGIVAAEDNEMGVIGVAPAVELYIAKSLFDDGSAYISDIVDGIEWAVEEEVDVISMSLGINIDFQSWHDACDAADGAGIVVVAAAGNDGASSSIEDNVNYPAAYSSVIAVAATDSNDERAWWSSTGPDVEIAAPGVGILSTYPGGYATMSGTSMACPHVAGTAALVIASGISDNDAVRTCLRETAEDLGESGKDNLYGYGLVNADEAVPPTVPNTPPVADAGPNQTALMNENVTFDGSGSYDIDDNIATYEWGFGDGTTGTGMTPTHAYEAAGTYTANLTVTDDDGLEDTNTVMVTVVTEEPAYTMHIDSIVVSTDSKTRGRNTFVWAIATVTILDESNNRVEGATVSGLWSNATTDTDSGLTDASGKVSLKSNKVKNAQSRTNFTFTVDNVSSLAGWAYNQTANVETSDSITVP